MPWAFSRYAKTNKGIPQDHTKIAEAIEGQDHQNSLKTERIMAEMQHAYRRGAEDVYQNYAGKIAAFDHDFIKNRMSNAATELQETFEQPSNTNYDYQAKARAHFANDIGFDPKPLKSLNKAWNKKFFEKLSAHFGVYAKPRFEDVITPIPEIEWTMYQPPYDGWQYGTEEWGDAFSLGHNRIVDPNAGFVRNEVWMNNPSAGDSDFGNNRQDAQLVVLHKAKGTGPLDIRIYGEVNDAFLEFFTIDEFGWSESASGFGHSLMAHVIHPNVSGPSFAGLGNTRWDSDETERKTYETLPKFATISVVLTSNGSVAKGETVAVRFGCRSQMGVHTNDVEIHHRSNHAWRFNRVDIRTKP